MRKLLVTEFITLDGVIEAPGGDETDHPHGGWTSRLSDPESGQYKMNELIGAEALLLGRKTYEQFAGYWPTADVPVFADRINFLPKYILSSGLSEVKWNNSHLLRDVVKDVNGLKNDSGGPILVYDSGTLVKTLLELDLVDELRLQLYPVAIGGGIGIFGDTRKINAFELRSSKALSNGVLLLEYVKPG